jgi:small GTP-binding protein
MIEELGTSFAQIEADLNYRKAQDSLRGLVQNLDLTPQECRGLESEIEDLANFLDKLEHTVIQVAAFGMVGRGKSSILNALVGRPVFLTGALHGVTQTSQLVEWGLSAEYQGLVTSVGDAQIQLIDTPGIDEVAGGDREQMARTIASRADLLLFIIAGDITQVEYDALVQLRQSGKPMLLVFNKIDQYSEADRTAIWTKICHDRLQGILSPEEIVLVAAAPRLVEHRNGQYQRVPGPPQIDALKLKIISILEREGKSLAALNSMLFATDVNEQMVERKLLIREETANQLIWRAVLSKAAAIATNPITALDIFTGAVVDVVMILSLSRVYGMPMTQTAALGLLQKIALSMVGISASEVFASWGLSSLKIILGAAAPITGGASLAPYLSVAITQAAIAGVATYAIGQVTKVYLANGASWGPASPKTIVQEILASLDEESILHRIKTELQLKLNPP